MIYLLTRDLHPHSGMKTFAQGLRVVGEGRIQVVDMTRAGDIRARAGDLIVFDDSIGPDGQDLVGRWADRGTDFAVLIHSPLLQMDVSNEWDAVMAMLDSKAVNLVLTADEKSAPLLGRAAGNSPALWLPHCVPAVPVLAPHRPRHAPRRTPLCWLPLTLPDDDPYYRHKNAVCQLAAAALCGVSVTVATNTASPRLRRTATLLSVPLHEKGHVPQARFGAFLADVSVGLCVSLAESFCYNAVEMMLRGVPVLFGPALRWAWRDPELVDLCGVADPGSPQEIAAQLRLLLTDTERRESAVMAGYRTATEVVTRNHTAARQLITRLADRQYVPAAEVQRLAR
ncbi:MAG: hypothetical protein HOY69_28895 [Streptomyces sp.]|nr:hypothetical protein [Streptomyces sp.]